MRYAYLVFYTLSNGKGVNSGILFSRKDAMLHAKVNAAYRPEIRRMSYGGWKDGRTWDAPTFRIMSEALR